LFLTIPSCARIQLQFWACSIWLYDARISTIKGYLLYPSKNIPRNLIPEVPEGQLHGGHTADRLATQRKLIPGFPGGCCEAGQIAWHPKAKAPLNEKL
jgi:hypothetical protein